MGGTRGTIAAGIEAMTLDPDVDAADQAIRDALDELRGVLAGRGATSYVGTVDYLKLTLREDRQAFVDSVNGGGVWRNMGSIFDNADGPTLQALLRLADALDAADLASDSTMDDADRIRQSIADGSLPPPDRP
jgi:hypothetical protein